MMPAEHGEAAREGVDEELQGRVRAVGATPDADEEVHRDEHYLPEQVEQDQVERDEHADEPGLEQQQQREVLAHAVLDAARRDHRKHGQQCGEEHHRQRQPVHAEVKRRVEARDPGQIEFELHA